MSIDMAEAHVGRGSVVRYHGSRTEDHGEYIVVMCEPNDRLVIADRDYPATTVLRQVRRGSITPTGERVRFCGCGHEIGHVRDRFADGRCTVTGCTCTHHADDGASA